MTPATKQNLWRWHLGALLLYTLLAVLIIDHGISMTNDIFGQGSDPSAFIWFLAWWPWAIAHHLDPLYTNLIWQPFGVHLAWVASIPLLSLAGLPFTLLSGPILTFNVIVLAAPIASAWAAYRLCLRIAGSAPPAIIGGFLFGFSSYEMAQDSAAPNLSVTFILPWLLLLILRRLDNEITRRHVVFGASVLLIGQFLIGAEVFAMIFIFGGAAWLLALAYLPARRLVLRRLFIDGLLAAPSVTLCVSPFLISMVRHLHDVQLPAAWPYYFTTDLLNFFIPAKANLLAGHFFTAISDRYNSGFQEEGAYLGLPLLLIICLFGVENRRRGIGRLLIVAFLIFALASLGPYLWIGGHFVSVGLPWLLFVKLPILSSALPARFMLFASLVVAIIAARWTADGVATPGWRFRMALAILACITILPRPFPWIAAPHSTFFQPGRVQAALGPRPRILVLPFAINGPSSFWQQESGFSFAMTGGYLGFPPAAVMTFPAVAQLFGNFQNPTFLSDMRDFCARTQTQYLVLEPETSAALANAVAALGWPAKHVDDVLIYTVPGQAGQSPHD